MSYAYIPLVRWTFGVARTKTSLHSGKQVVHRPSLRHRCLDLHYARQHLSPVDDSHCLFARGCPYSPLTISDPNSRVWARKSVHSKHTNTASTNLSRTGKRTCLYNTRGKTTHVIKGNKYFYIQGINKVIMTVNQDHMPHLSHLLEYPSICFVTYFVLFLDEPTSGLDSTTALTIVQMLHDIAEDGKTVVTTIHQPSSRLFHKFDKLILLGKGSLLYVGKAADATEYFSSIGCTPFIATNPAELLLDLANGNINDVFVPSELEDRVQVGNLETETRNGKPSSTVVHEYLVEAYETKVAEREKKMLMIPISIDEELKIKASSPKREWGASWCEQFLILFWRGLKERRHDYLSWLRITQVLVIAAGLLFFIGVFWGFFPVFTAIFTFPQERAMLSKERAVDMSRLSAYFPARTSSDLPLDLFLPVIFLVVVYFMAGLKATSSAFFLSMLTVFLSIIAAQVDGFSGTLDGFNTSLDGFNTILDVSSRVLTFLVRLLTFLADLLTFISFSLSYHAYFPSFITWLKAPMISPHIPYVGRGKEFFPNSY
ncbi:hypothetical protein ACHQM5_024338 [Ranunculus cassubicifolius]